MIRPKNKTENLLLSIIKNCETPFEQTHRKAEETLQFELDKSREKIHFNPPVEVKEDWMIGLATSEVYNSIFNLTEENNKVELYTGYLEYEFSDTQLKDNIAEVLCLSDISPEELKTEKFGPKDIETIENSY